MRITSSLDVAAVRERCRGPHLVLNHQAAYFHGGVQQYLAERFPEPSRWEKK